MKEQEVVLCPYKKGDKRIDCFGRSSLQYSEKWKNHCTILKNTDFKEHDCPFYKSQKDFYMGIKIYGWSNSHS